MAEKNPDKKPKASDTPEASEAPDVLSELFCASCGRVVLLEEMSDGSARQFAGKIFCPQCLSAKERVEAVKCKKCGAYETPVFDGRTLLCRKCGEELKVRARVGVTPAHSGQRRTALKLCPVCSGIVGAGATTCGHCGAPLTPSARRALSGNSLPGGFFGGAISMGVVAVLALFAGAYIFQVGMFAPQAEDKIASQFEALEQKIADLQKALDQNEMKDTLEHSAAKEQLDQKIEDLRISIQAMPDNDAALGALARRMERVEASIEVLAKRPMTTSAATGGGTQSALEAVDDIINNLKDESKEAEAEERPADNEDAARMDRDFETLRKDAAALVRQQLYGKALDMWDSRPEYKSASWQAKREKEKRRIRDLAKEQFRKDLGEAEKQLADGNYKEAVDIYERAIEYGIPEIGKLARKRLEEIRGGALPASLSAEAVKQIEILRNAASQDYERAEAATKLGDLRERASGPALVAALDDRDWYVRGKSAEALAILKYVPAVPKLIENLGHTMFPLRKRCAESLVIITGQNLGEKREKWQAWWDKNGESLMKDHAASSTDTTPKAPSNPLEGLDNAFQWKVAAYKAAEQTIVFVKQAGQKVAVGDVGWIVKDGRRLCQVTFDQVGEMHAAGSLKGLQDMGAIAKGDSLIVALLK